MSTCSKELRITLGEICPCDTGIVHDPANVIRPAIKDYTDTMFVCPACTTIFPMPDWDGIFRQSGSSSVDSDCCSWTLSAGGAVQWEFNGGKNLSQVTCLGRVNPYIGGGPWAVAGWKLGVYCNFGGGPFDVAWFGVGPDPPLGITDTPVGIYTTYAPAGPCTALPATLEIVAKVPPP